MLSNCYNNSIQPRRQEHGPFREIKPTQPTEPRMSPSFTGTRSRRSAEKNQRSFGLKKVSKGSLSGKKRATEFKNNYVPSHFKENRESYQNLDRAEADD